MTKTLLALTFAALAGCAADDALEQSDAGHIDEAATCEVFRDESVRVDQPRECGIYGGAGELVLTGVYYYDAENDITWVQDVRDRGGRLGAYGQIDQWTAGCHWFTCDEVR